MTFAQAATKSSANFCFPSAEAYTSASARSSEFEPKARSARLPVKNQKTAPGAGGHDPTLIRDGARDECAIEPVLAGSSERSARRRGAPGNILLAMPIRDDRRRKASMAIAARSLPALLVLAAVFIANSSQTMPTGGD
jgi:hypothetical protein